MAEEKMPLTLIRHRGFFDYSRLLQSVRSWYLDDDFTVQIGMHKQKAVTPLGLEHDFSISGEKSVTEYVRFKIDVKIRLAQMRDVEIIRDGKKSKMQDGQVLVEITPTLVFDWQNRFSGTGAVKPFLQGLDNFYRKYIIKYKIADYWEDMILIKTGTLARTIREALGQEVL